MAVIFYFRSGSIGTAALDDAYVGADSFTIKPASKNQLKFLPRGAFSSKQTRVEPPGAIRCLG
jgi:hypothetical protein